MKIRLVLITILLITGIKGFSQPLETIYPGTTIYTGYIDNASYGPFNIGFNFNYFGNSYSQFYVSSNGLVLFGAGSTNEVNVSIPNSSSPNNFIAGFWDDLAISYSGKILYATIGAAPTRKLIIQFVNMDFYNIPSAFGTFLVILYEGSNKIQVQYRLILDYTSTRAHGGTATIGLENAAGTAGVQYAYNNASAITNEQAISFTPAGPTYTTDPAAVYDGVYLTPNITLPDPGITVLTNPAHNSVIGSSQTFQWTEASNAASYTLYVSHRSDLTDGTIYFPGSNLSYNVTGLTLDAEYFWGVFATNASGTTWCEIKRFTTASTPPLAAVPQTIWVEQNQEKTIKLNYTGGDAGAKTAIITSLPATGQLYQYNGGVKGALISSVPATVTDADRNVIYFANGTTGNGAGNFNFKIHDGTGDSPDAQIRVNVSPPGMPNLLSTGKATTYAEMQFDLTMADPAGKQNQFIITVNGAPATLSSLTLKTGDPYAIIANFASPITITDAVTITYTAGDITSTQGGLLASFNSQSVTLLAQTITFTTNLAKKYNESPFALTASASSGLPMTYSSSDLTVATISGSTVTLISLGTSDITARQAGNTTYSPAKYVRILTVAKGDHTITFSALPAKTYGDADFLLSAVASSGLSVTYTSSNPAVATVAGNSVHIVSAGITTITASQAGNALWNPAPDVPQTLTVNKANQTITFGVLPGKTYGDPDFSLSATASSGFSVTYTSSNPAVATVMGNLVHITGAGTTTITASQAGDSNHNPAPDVQQTLTVNKANQTITFSVLSDMTYGDPDFSLSATASSGLSVTYVSGNTAVATVAANTVHIAGAGTTTITASQAGNANYNAASEIQRNLTVNKAVQTITFTDYPERLLATESHALAATSSGGVAVVFESLDINIATVSGNLVTGVENGSVQIRAYNEGTQNYLPAEAFVTIAITDTHRDIMHLFTPNNDGFNDLWELPELQTWGKCEVRVFSRSGKLVFSDNNYNNTWNGTSDGKPVPEGAYYYVIKTVNAGTVKGTVNIVR